MLEIVDEEYWDQRSNNTVVAVVDRRLETSSCVVMKKKLVIQNTMNSTMMYRNYYSMDMVNTTNRMNSFHRM